MKPFVLLATRAEDVPADEEYALFLRYTGLSPDELIRVRLEAEPMPRIDLDELSGIFVGGGPFNASDPLDKKSPTQRRVEQSSASSSTKSSPATSRSSAPATASVRWARTRARSSTAPTPSRSASCL